MPAPMGSYGQQAPTCFEKIKMEFGFGFCFGLATGALFGGFSALRYGMRGRQLINTVGRVMLQGGGSCGTFMSIGSALRC